MREISSAISSYTEATLTIGVVNLRVYEAMTNRHVLEILLDNHSYTFDGKRWYDSKSFQTPPAKLLPRLNAELTSILAKSDAEITDFDELISESQKARKLSQLTRALNLAEQALTIRPNDSSAMTQLTSALRSLNRAEEALARTDGIKHSNAALFTSRAAAYCDVEKWEEAKKELSKALAINGTPETFSVVQRIKSARPDLY